MSHPTCLKRVVGISYGLGQPPKLSDTGIPILRATNVHRGSIRAEGLIFAAKDDLPLDRAPLLRQGEILVVRSGAYTGDSALVTRDWEGSAPGYDLRVTPTQLVESRFVAYTLLSSRALDEMKILSNRAAQPHLNAEELAEVTINLPAVAEQRAIADYLDTETARIDALISKKRRMIELLEQGQTAEIDGSLWSGDLVKLKHVAQLLPGYAFSSADFGPDFDGPRLLRGTNVGVGRIDWSDAVRLAMGGAMHDRYLLRPGDVVLGMDRPFIKSGTRVAIAGLDEEGSLLVQRVCRVRPSITNASVLIASAIRSPRFAAYIESDLTGVSVPHLSDEQIGEFLVPAACGTGDSELVKHLEWAGAHYERLKDRLSMQIDLLTEHRQAIITAAVTGELEIRGAA